MIETVKFSLETSFSSIQVCKIVRREIQVISLLGSNGTGRGWWSFVPWTVFKGETVPGLMACKWSG